jgi:hypothetical protein
VGRRVAIGKKQHVFIGSKQGRHPTIGKKTIFAEEK